MRAAKHAMEAMHLKMLRRERFRVLLGLGLSKEEALAVAFDKAKLALAEPYDPRIFDDNSWWEKG